MTNRQQSAFFLAIVFLFTSGIGLVIYRQYDLYYQQKTATDLETAETPSVVVQKSSTSSVPAQITGWKTYENSIAGFTISYPIDWHEKDVPFRGTTTVFYRSTDPDPLNGFQNSEEYNPGPISIQIWPDKNNLGVLQYFKSNNYSDESLSEIEINGSKAYKVGPHDLSDGTIYIEKDNKIYVIDEICCDSQIDYIFQKMWPTFKFTN